MIVTVNERERISILELSGRFDNFTAPEVRETLKSAATERTPHVIVDLEAVPFIDSTGLATLVHGLKHCRQLGGDLHLCGLQPPVRMIFELTRLDKAFEIFKTRDDALDAVTHAQVAD